MNREALNKNSNCLDCCCQDFWKQDLGNSTNDTSIFGNNFNAFNCWNFKRLNYDSISWENKEKNFHQGAKCLYVKQLSSKLIRVK